MQLSHKVLLASIVILVGSLIFFYAGFPLMFKYIVKYQTSLRDGNLMRKFYLKLPIALDFRVYFFNVTNPGEVQLGATPILHEIGPYCYDAYKEKIDVVDNKTDDSLTYTPYETYFFNQKCTGNLSQDDAITMLHPLIVSIVASVRANQPALLNTINKAINSVFHNPTSMYSTMKVRDILFDGIVINCTVKDFAGKAVCSQLKAQIPDLVEIEPKVYLFSLFGSRNGTLPKRVKVGRGINKYTDLGKLLAVNNQLELDIWGTEECNKFHGTDGWIFPPFLENVDRIWSYSPDLCRSVHMDFTEPLKVNGILVKRYDANLGDQTANEEDKCYCPTSGTCLPKGIFDLNKCLGVPIYATLPHFYGADETYLSQVVGLSPNKSNHALYGYFEPTLGVPIEAKKRMQLNLEIVPLQKIDFMKTVPNVLHPMFWLEEGVVLEGELLQTIKTVFLLLLVKNVFKYLFILASLGGLAVGGYLHMRNNKMATITPVSAVMNKITGNNNNQENNGIHLNNKNNSDKGEINHAMDNHQ